MSYRLKDIIDQLASIAAEDESCNINAIIPLSVAELPEDSVLTKRRKRFQMLLGGALPLLSAEDRLEVSDNIRRLDLCFQQLQIKEFDVSAFEDIEFIPSPTIIPEGFLHSTSGLPGILATTPDIAFSGLKDFRLQDFKTIVDFIMTIRPVAKENVSAISEVIDSLLDFSRKWSDSTVEWYLSTDDPDSQERALEYMKTIRQIIKELL